MAGCRAIYFSVMEDHQLVIAGHLDIQLDETDAQLDRALEGGKRVLRSVRRVTAMGADGGRKVRRPDAGEDVCKAAVHDPTLSQQSG